MKQISGLARGTVGLTVGVCKGYWNWVNKAVDEHKLSEKVLADAVKKGHAKSIEDAERSSKRILKGALVAAPILILSVSVLAVLPKLAEQQAAIQLEGRSPAPQAKTPAPVQASNPPAVTPSPQSRETSISALVQKKGSNFSYETSGMVQESDRAIVVTYTRSWDCAEGSPVSTARQEWKATFDLATGKWTDKVRELSACLGNPDQKWTDYSTHPSQFSVESNGSETILRADAQDTDDSVIVKDSLIVKYNRPANFPPLAKLSASKPATSKPTATSEPIAPQPSAEEKIIAQGTLTANDPDSKINIRDGASMDSFVRHYGIVGDRVSVLESTQNSQMEKWFRVRFSQSGATGWVRSEFIVINEPEPRAESSPSPTTETSSEQSPLVSSAGSTSGSGRCTNPEDLDSRGHRCGGRSSSSRSRRSTH